MTATLGWIGFALVAAFLIQKEVGRLRRISLSTNDRHDVPEANASSDNGGRVEAYEEQGSRVRGCTQCVPAAAGHEPFGVEVQDRTLAHR